MKSNRSGFGVVELLLIIVTIGLIGALGWIAYDRQVNKADKNAVSTAQADEKTDVKPIEQEELKPVVLAKGTFGDNGDHGTLQAEGYATTVKRTSTAWPGCQSDNCELEEYVFFKITRTENSNIFDFINKYQGNAYVQDKAIGVGCIINNEISAVNASSKGIAKVAITPADTTALLASTEEKPIVLEIERLPAGPGYGSPSCYSHFASFKVIK